MKLKELLWDMFKKSGNVDIFMAYKDYEKAIIVNKNNEINRFK